MYEPTSDVMTRHEINIRMNSAEAILTTPNIGENLQNEMIEYYGFLVAARLFLDELVEFVGFVIDESGD